MTTIVLVETTNAQEIQEAQTHEIVELAVTDLDMVGGGNLTGLVV